MNKFYPEKIFFRTLAIFGIGLFLNAFPFFRISSLRIMGVLQRIALCYFFASLIFVNTNKKGQLIWAVGLLMFQVQLLHGLLLF